MNSRFPVWLFVCLIALVSALPLRAACSTPALTALPPVVTEHAAAEFAVGDVDADGELDLVTVSTSAGNINVRLGNGDGTFGNELTYTAPSPTEVALGDLDGDGFLDIFVGSEPAQTPACISFGSCAGISVLLNDGDGTFGNATTTPVPYAASIVAVDAGDFNADGTEDILVAAPPLTSGNPALHAFFGNEEGGFITEHSWAVDGTLLDAVAENLSPGTGQADVIALVGPGTSSTSTRVLTYASDFGSFPAISATRNLTTATSPSAHLTTADFNGNGRMDIGVAYRHAMQPESPLDMWGVAVILANGAGSLTFGGSYADSELPPAAGIAAEDVDEDGDVDVMLGFAGGGWRVFRRQSGNFENPPTLIQGSSGGTDVVTQDINRDGRPDFLFLAPGGQSVNILVNTCASRYVKVTVDSSPAPSTYGTAVTFTIDLQHREHAPVPAGTVTLYEGATILGQTTVNANGTASITLSNLSVGTHSVHAHYVSTNGYTTTDSSIHAHTVTLPPFGAPFNVSATGNAAANRITVKWTATADSQSHDVLRRMNGAWAVIAPGLTADSYVDLNVVNTSAYVYAVRSHSTSGETSPDSASDIATSASLTLPFDKKIRATDITTTRTLVNSLRSAGGLTAFTFTDASLSGVQVKALHITELRTALNQARTALGFASLPFTNPTLTAGTTPVHAIDIQEIRNSFQ
jgi:hypothetical protein